MSPYTAINIVLAAAVVFLSGLLGYETGLKESCQKSNAAPTRTVVPGV